MVMRTHHVIQLQMLQPSCCGRDLLHFDLRRSEPRCGGAKKAQNHDRESSEAKTPMADNRRADHPRRASIITGGIPITTTRIF